MIALDMLFRPRGLLDQLNSHRRTRYWYMNMADLLGDGKDILHFTVANEWSL